MTPEERARMTVVSISDSGAELHEEAWVDQVWCGGPAEAIIAAAIRDAEARGAAAERERWASEIKAALECRKVEVPSHVIERVKKAIARIRAGESGEKDMVK